MDLASPKAAYVLATNGCGFGAIEARFTAFEQRFGVQEERMSRMLAILVRLAERQEGRREPLLEKPSRFDTAEIGRGTVRHKSKAMTDPPGRDAPVDAQGTKAR